MNTTVETFAQTLNGRKFTDDDVRANADLRIFAVQFAGTCDNAFGFMGDMAATVRRGRALSAPQARGVLNVWLAGYRRQTAEASPEVFQLAGLIAMFDGARKHLKYPKLVVCSEGREPVVLSQAGQRSATPGAINVTGQGRFGDRAYFGKVMPNGEWRPGSAATPQVLNLLRELDTDLVATVQRSARLSGYCAFCDRPLEDERSTTVGYGPVCAKHYSLPWGQRADITELARTA